MDSKISDLNIEILNINKMASGHLCLDLTEKVKWEDFPSYAKLLIKLLSGKILSKVDGPDIRIWDVRINKNNYRLTFDDFPLMVALESSDDEADNEIKRIMESILKLRKA